MRLSAAIEAIDHNDDKKLRHVVDEDLMAARDARGAKRRRELMNIGRIIIRHYKMYVYSQECASSTLLFSVNATKLSSIWHPNSQPPWTFWTQLVRKLNWIPQYELNDLISSAQYLLCCRQDEQHSIILQFNRMPSMTLWSTLGRTLLLMIWLAQFD